MAITYKGDISLGLSVNDSGQTLKRLMVFFCENGETISSLRTHRDFPVLGTAHPLHPSLKAASITVTPACDGKKNKYEVEVSYTSPRTVPVLTDTVQFDRPFNVTLSTIEKVVPFEFSYDLTDDSGRPVQPVVTTAGTAIPANTVQTSLLLKFSYRLRSFKPSWILETADTVNRSPVKVCGLDIPAECGLIKTVAAEIVSEDSSPVWDHVHRIVHDHAFGKRAERPRPRERKPEQCKDPVWRTARTFRHADQCHDQQKRRKHRKKRRRPR